MWFFRDREIQKRKGRPCERPQVQVCENARSRLASNSTVYTSVAGVNFSKRLRLRFPQFKSLDSIHPPRSPGGFIGRSVDKAH
jgi:hypothetical protein